MVLVEKHWSEEISEVTEEIDYQTAEVEVEDPRLITKDYDVTTGETTITGNGTVYSGPARIGGLRSGVDRTNTNLANPSTYNHVRVQLPHGALRDYDVQRGMFVRIIRAPRNVALEGETVVILSSFQGSSSATRTFLCKIDGDMRG